MRSFRATHLKNNKKISLTTSTEAQFDEKTTDGY